jgi:hypothetical protein
MKTLVLLIVSGALAIAQYPLSTTPGPQHPTMQVGAVTFNVGNVTYWTGSGPRCTVAGTLRVGQTTTVAGDCGTAVDTGLRVQ